MYIKFLFKQYIYILLKTNLIYIKINNINDKKQLIKYFINFFNKKIFKNKEQKNFFIINNEKIQNILFKINSFLNKILIIVNITSNINLNYLNFINYFYKNNIFFIIIYSENKKIDIINRYNNHLIKQFNINIEKIIFNKNDIFSYNLFFLENKINHFFNYLNQNTIERVYKLIYFLYYNTKKKKIIYNNIINNSWINNLNLKIKININKIIIKINKYYYFMNKYKNIDKKLFIIKIIYYLKKYILYPERELNSHSY